MLVPNGKATAKKPKFSTVRGAAIELEVSEQLIRKLVAQRGEQSTKNCQGLRDGRESVGEKVVSSFSGQKSFSAFLARSLMRFSESNSL
jgi:hypothetical protein